MTPALLPTGQLVIDGRPTTASERALVEAHQSGRDGALFIRLGTDLLSIDLPAPWAWLRSAAKAWLQSWCLAGTPTPAPPPTSSSLTDWLNQAPPFSGAQHLSTDVATSWWQAFSAHLQQLTTAHPDGTEGWLRDHAPMWHRVGRVTFHLAENPTDPERPFAFLATFTETVSGSGQLQHLPLARALQRYTSSSDKAALETLLAPVRSAAACSDLIRDWLASRRLFQPQSLPPAEAHQLLVATLDLQDAGIIMKLPDWWRPLQPLRPTITVTLEAPQRTSLGTSALLSFRIDRSLDGQPLTDEEWDKLMSAETGLVSLRGKWVEVSARHLREALHHWQRVEAAHRDEGIPFHQAMRWLAGLRTSGPSPLDDDTSATLDGWSHVAASRDLQRDLATLLDPQPIDPPDGLNATLRPYQLAGLNWLHRMDRLGLGACLADDMGLGKTLQVIALLLLTHRRHTAPTLIIVPASLLGNWRSELRRFAPSLRVFFAHPSLTERPLLDTAVQHPAEAFADSDIVLTTYHLLQRTESWQRHTWQRVILDEAQAIKNPAAGITQAVKLLQAPHRIAMTGTPIENRPGDLWSLFDFLNPGLLGSAADFQTFLQQRCTGKSGFAPSAASSSPTSCGG